MSELLQLDSIACIRGDRLLFEGLSLALARGDALWLRGPNGAGTEYSPSVFEAEDGRQLYYSTGGAIGGGTQEIMMSRETGDGSFGPGTPVAELNTVTDDAMPNVRKDGLEIVFTSTRAPSAGAFDIWTATRSSVREPWSAPVSVTAVNTTGAETRPSLSWDATRLYVGRSGDIVLSRR